MGLGDWMVQQTVEKPDKNHQKTDWARTGESKFSSSELILRKFVLLSHLCSCCGFIVVINIANRIASRTQA